MSLSASPAIIGHDKVCHEAEQHPRFQEFKDWMHENQGGRRADLWFPYNFFAWLNGERW